MSRPEQPGTAFSRSVLTRLDDPDPLRSALPQPLTALVGRTGDVGTCLVLLRTARTRLLTLSGPGGVGKTRLALAIAHDAKDAFPHGVVFVSLSEIAEPNLVLPTIARAIGARDESGGTAFERVVARLAARRALIVLDNLEHVLQVAPRLAELLQDCPHLTLLVTSRVSLRIRGEIEYQVLPLSLPDPAMPEDTGKSESVALFVQTVQGFNPRFTLTTVNGQLVADICRRLDGLPLAIELAASRMRSLTPETLLQMLDHRLAVLAHGPSDLPERQRTLRSAIRWSYDLLTGDEQAIYRVASIFTGSFDLPALSDLSGFDDITVTDGIETLLDHHLVRRLDILSGMPRYWLLETIREYGLEELANTGKTEELQRTHAEHYMAVAAAAAPHLVDRDQVMWLDRLEHDHDNLRSALGWLVEHDPPSAARMVHDLWRFWWARGYMREGLALADRVLQRRASLPPRNLGLLLYAAGELNHSLSRLDEASRFLGEALSLLRPLGDPDLTAACLNALGIVARDRGELRQAQALNEEALALAETAGVSRQMANSLNNLAAVAYYLGDTAEAQARWQQAVDIMRDSGDIRGYSMVIGNLGVIEGLLGNNDRAVELKEESLRIAREMRDPEATLTAMASLAGILFEAGNYQRAETLLMEALPQSTETGDVRLRAVMLHTLGMIVGNRGDHHAAALHFAESLHHLARSGQMPGVATDLEGLARTATYVGLHEDAVRLFAAAHAIRERTGAMRESIADREKDDELIASRAAFTRSQSDELWRAGIGWTIEDIVTEAAAMPAKVSDASSTPGPSDERTSRPHHPFGLTGREFEILGYLVRHHTDREIGDALFISSRTVTTHVASIINKLGVSSRREAARLAEEHHLLGDA